jgi:hypothetical protein
MIQAPFPLLLLSNFVLSTEQLFKHAMMRLYLDQDFIFHSSNVCLYRLHSTNQRRTVHRTICPCTHVKIVNTQSFILFVIIQPASELSYAKPYHDKTTRRCFLDFAIFLESLYSRYNFSRLGKEVCINSPPLFAKAFHFHFSIPSSGLESNWHTVKSFRSSNFGPLSLLL